MLIDANSLAIDLTQSQKLPQEGPKCIPVVLDFNIDTVFEIDFSQLVNKNFISMIQTIYIDQSNNNGGIEMLITPNGSGQNIKINYQLSGYVNVLAPNPAKFTITGVGNPTPGDTTTLVFINVAIPGHTWSNV